MTNKLYTDKKRVMLEDGKGTRYEFFCSPVYASNQFMEKVAYYEPTIRWCQKFETGSTWSDRRTTVEDGNAFYKELLSKGFQRVEKKSFV